MALRRSLVIACCLLIHCAAQFGIVSKAYSGSVTLYYYSAENCPHCQEFGPTIHALANQNNDLSLVEKDIWKDRSAFQELLELLETHGDLPVATPTLFLGNKVWVGID
ncbi:MAG: thioredoxin family protein, partial [Gammaproteobacteria bacterium]|nr:thioredoxin family protein [Gammaproteobacteria bacterium]NIR92520.1 thioredoxin family protein [Gammaproteobacteria bacterium]NIW43392.1 hypothetical protein [Gammaproteobacteria bacterium]